MSVKLQEYPTRILLIEDDSQDVDLIEEYLAKSKHFEVRFESADTLCSGLERLSERGIDLDQFCRELIEEMLSGASSQSAVSVTRSDSDVRSVSVLPSSSDRKPSAKAMPGGLIAFSSRGNCTDVCLDEKLLRQILTNLLSNAVIAVAKPIRTCAKY